MEVLLQLLQTALKEKGCSMLPQTVVFVINCSEPAPQWHWEAENNEL